MYQKTKKKKKRNQKKKKNQKEKKPKKKQTKQLLTGCITKTEQINSNMARIMSPLKYRDEIINHSRGNIDFTK